MIRSLTALAALAVLSHAAQAFVLIDDFTVGEYHGRIDWPDTFDSHERTGLDRAHSVFGRRAADVGVMTNFDRVPVFIDIGGGEARISHDSPSGDIATDSTIIFGGVTGVNIDLSAEDEIWVDLYTVDPPNRFADQWSVTVVDFAGRADTNPAWLLRTGGIYFRKQDFEPNIDWTAINQLRFRQIFSPNSGQVPDAYALTSVYAVPEPGTAAGVAAVLLGLRASSRRRRSAA